MSNRRVYIAAPLAEAELANELADRLRINGHNVVSRWHRVVASEGRVSDPVIQQDREMCLQGNLMDMSFSDWVVAITYIGIPRATLAEIGWAIGHGKRVVWLQGIAGEGSCLFDAHPACRIVWVEFPHMGAGQLAQLVERAW